MLSREARRGGESTVSHAPTVRKWASAVLGSTPLNIMLLVTLKERKKKKVRKIHACLPACLVRSAEAYQSPAQNRTAPKVPAGA